MCKAIDYAQNIMNIFQDETKEQEQLYNLVHKCDLKTCDLLHEIELKDIKGMYHAYLILKELKKIRQVRRKAKDELEYLEMFDTFKNNQKKLYENLFTAINRKQKYMQFRVYHPKIESNFIDVNNE